MYLHIYGRKQLYQLNLCLSFPITPPYLFFSETLILVQIIRQHITLVFNFLYPKFKYIYWVFIYSIFSFQVVVCLLLRKAVPFLHYIQVSSLFSYVLYYFFKSLMFKNAHVNVIKGKSIPKLPNYLGQNQIECNFLSGFLVMLKIFFGLCMDNGSLFYAAFQLICCTFNSQNDFLRGLLVI